MIVLCLSALQVQEPLKSLEEVRSYVAAGMASLRSDHKRPLNPTPYKVRLMLYVVFACIFKPGSQYLLSGWLISYCTFTCAESSAWWLFLWTTLSVTDFVLTQQLCLKPCAVSSCPSECLYFSEVSLCCIPVENTTCLWWSCSWNLYRVKLSAESLFKWLLLCFWSAGVSHGYAVQVYSSALAWVCTHWWAVIVKRYWLGSGDFAHSLCIELSLFLNKPRGHGAACLNLNTRLHYMPHIIVLCLLAQQLFPGWRRAHAQDLSWVLVKERHASHVSLGVNWFWIFWLLSSFDLEFKLFPPHCHHDHVT